VVQSAEATNQQSAFLTPLATKHLHAYIAFFSTKFLYHSKLEHSHHHLNAGNKPQPSFYCFCFHTVRGDLLFTVFCLLITLSMKSTKSGAGILYTGCQNIWHTDRSGLAAHQFQDWRTLIQDVPMRHQTSQVGKTFFVTPFKRLY